MTNAMTCDAFNDRLMAYLENEVDDATRAALERHAATCAECGPVLADIRKIRVDAANLPELAPSRDLWAGVEARIETPVLPIGSRDRARIGTLWSRTSVRVALFAASLMGAAGVGYLSAGVRGPVDSIQDVAGLTAGSATVTIDTVFAAAPVTTEPRVEEAVVREPMTPVTQVTQVAQAPAAAALPAQMAVATLTSDYDREIARLRRMIEGRRNQLDPATVATIEKNIQVIDAAILDSKKAIAADPSSAFLIESLNQSLQTKVELMRTAAALPIRM